MGPNKFNEIKSYLSEYMYICENVYCIFVNNYYSFSVQACASTFGDICSTVGRETTEDQLVRSTN